MGIKSEDYNFFYSTFIKKEKKLMRRPGVEPGSAAWKATMLTVTPPTPDSDGY